MKIFLDYSKQIAKLKERNLRFTDEDAAIEILRMENYYFLINGYNDVFLENKRNIEDEDIYLEGVNFDEIYSLYNFDRKLRINIFSKILILENNIKSLLSYSFPEDNEIDHNKYLRIQNFNTLDSSTNNEKIKERELEIKKTIDHIGSEVNKHKDTNNYISHYLDKHKYLPPWVLFKLLSFGTISRLLMLIKNIDIEYITRNLGGLRSKDLRTYTWMLTIFRNISAHNERIFDVKTIFKLRKTNIHKYFAEPGINYGESDVFALCIIFKKMLSYENFKSFYDELEKELDELESKINPVSFLEVKKKIGLPQNWKDIRDR